MINNPLKSKLAAEQVVMGSFVTIPSAALAEIMGLAGFDFVVIDMEHGPVELEAAEHIVWAAELVGVTPIIRVPHNTPHLTLRALDIGAMGVHIFDQMDLEAVADTAARLNRWDFMLTAAPYPILGGTGYPLNAIATF